MRASGLLGEMTFNGVSKRFEIDASRFEAVSNNLCYALALIRRAYDLPLDKYERNGPLEESDHAQRAIIEVANSMDIDLGSRWGNEIDLREMDDLSA